MHMELHEAIRRAYSGRTTQAAIAAALNTTQSTVSRWVNGDARPTYEDLARLEDAAGRPRGWVLRQVGLVTDAEGVETAIAVDPTIPEDKRPVLLELYRALAVSR